MPRFSAFYSGIKPLAKSPPSRYTPAVLVDTSVFHLR
jgi:hypothetical protein